MGSATVRAQSLANKANLNLTESTNKWNYDIAHEANEWNWANLQAQNEWNIQQWERENAYNSPAAQVQRYIEAGINPVWAIGNGDPGNASQLTSGTPQPANVPTMQPGHVDPEYDPYIAQHIGNIVAAARDVQNGLQGFAKLSLDNRSLDIQQAAQMSGSALNYAKVAETKAKTIAQNLENDWNIRTFDTRAHQVSVELDKLYKELDNLDANTAAARAKKGEIEAQTGLFTEQTNAVIASIRQRDREIAIAQQNANTASRNADINEQNAETNRGRLLLEDEKFGAQLKQWNNQNIMDFLKNFAEKHTNDAYMGVKLAGIGGSYEGHDESWDLPSVMRARQAGVEILQRAADNPSPQNIQDAAYASKVINQTDVFIRSFNGVQLPPNFNSTYQSIINPSEPWSQ